MDTQPADECDWTGSGSLKLFHGSFHLDSHQLILHTQAGLGGPRTFHCRATFTIDHECRMFRLHEAESNFLCWQQLKLTAAFCFTCPLVSNLKV